MGRDAIEVGELMSDVHDVVTNLESHFEKFRIKVITLAYELEVQSDRHSQLRERLNDMQLGLRDTYGNIFPSRKFDEDLAEYKSEIRRGN